MADYSRVGAHGWRQGDDSTDQARIGSEGWYNVAAVAGAAGQVSPLLSTVAFSPVFSSPLIRAAQDQDDA